MKEFHSFWMDWKPIPAHAEQKDSSGTFVTAISGHISNPSSSRSIEITEAAPDWDSSKLIEQVLQGRAVRIHSQKLNDTLYVVYGSNEKDTLRRQYPQAGIYSLEEYGLLLKGNLPIEHLKATHLTKCILNSTLIDVAAYPLSANDRHRKETSCGNNTDSNRQV